MATAGNDGSMAGRVRDRIQRELGADSLKSDSSLMEMSDEDYAKNKQSENRRNVTVTGFVRQALGGRNSSIEGTESQQAQRNRVEAMRKADPPRRKGAGVDAGDLDPKITF